jgi:hypothetical protein
VVLRGAIQHGLPLRFTNNADEEIKAANYPDIRFFTVGGHPAYHHVDVRETFRQSRQCSQ